MAYGRRVRRVVRKIDTWSVLKVSALFFLTLMLVLVLAGVLLWSAGSVIGAVGSVERFMQAIGFEDFRFIGVQLLRGIVAAGLVVVVLGTGFSVLVTVVYNLISDVVGGIQLTVLEEETLPGRPRPGGSSNGSPAPSPGPAVARDEQRRVDDPAPTLPVVPAVVADPARAS